MASENNAAPGLFETLPELCIQHVARQMMPTDLARFRMTCRQARDIRPSQLYQVNETTWSLGPFSSGTFATVSFPSSFKKKEYHFYKDAAAATAAAAVPAYKLTIIYNHSYAGVVFDYSRCATFYVQMPPVAQEQIVAAVRPQFPYKEFICAFELAKGVQTASRTYVYYYQLFDYILDPAACPELRVHKFETQNSYLQGIPNWQRPILYFNSPLVPEKHIMQTINLYFHDESISLRSNMNFLIVDDRGYKRVFSLDYVITQTEAFIYMTHTDYVLIHRIIPLLAEATRRILLVLKYDDFHQRTNAWLALRNQMTFVVDFPDTLEEALDLVGRPKIRMCCAPE